MGLNFDSGFFGNYNASLKDNMKDFSELSHSDKLRAVLAVLGEPVSAGNALQLAGIKQQQLTAAERRDVRDILSGTRVNEKKRLHLIAENKRGATLKELDVDHHSVLAFVSSVILEHIRERKSSGLGRRL